MDNLQTEKPPPACNTEVLKSIDTPGKKGTSGERHDTLVLCGRRTVPRSKFLDMYGGATMGIFSNTATVSSKTTTALLCRSHRHSQAAGASAIIMLSSPTPAVSLKIDGKINNTEGLIEHSS